MYKNDIICILVNKFSNFVIFFYLSMMIGVHIIWWYTINNIVTCIHTQLKWHTAKTGIMLNFLERIEMLYVFDENYRFCELCTLLNVIWSL